jgi:hypothetical protein
MFFLGKKPGPCFHNSSPENSSSSPKKVPHHGKKFPSRKKVPHLGKKFLTAGKNVATSEKKLAQLIAEYFRWQSLALSESFSTNCCLSGYPRRSHTKREEHLNFGKMKRGPQLASAKF